MRTEYSHRVMKQFIANRLDGEGEGPATGACPHRATGVFIALQVVLPPTAHRWNTFEMGHNGRRAVNTPGQHIIRGATPCVWCVHSRHVWVLYTVGRFGLRLLLFGWTPNKCVFLVRMCHSKWGTGTTSTNMYELGSQPESKRFIRTRRNSHWDNGIFFHAQLV